MAKKATKIKETDDVIIFKAAEKMTKAQFEAVSDMVRSEEAKTGKKIILMPASCELGGDA